MRGLGQLFTRSVGNPSDFYGDAWALQQFDGVSATWPTSGPYRGALSIPGVYRATLLISDLLRSLPWHVYRSRVGGPPQRLDPTPPLLNQPAPPDTRMSTFSSWTMDLLLEGNAIGIYASRNSEGWPTSAVPVPASAVYARRVQPGDGVPYPIGSVAYQVNSGTTRCRQPPLKWRSYAPFTLMS